MDYSLPTNSTLGASRVDFLQTFRKSCHHTILSMLHTSQSGHPGGSLSMLDFLITLYCFRISSTDEKIVISNGHISPGVYGVLAEMGVLDKDDLIHTYRQIGSPYEGHVTRHIPGIYFGTGPLGVGVSAAAGMAWAQKKNGSDKKVFATLGDGEAQEGQVHEMMLFANKYKLNNLVVFVDYNRVQLTSSLKETMPIDIIKMFEAGKWNVLEIDGHDYQQIWSAIKKADQSDRPTMIVGRTIMGKGIDLFEPDGQNFNPKWHGQAPKRDVIEAELPKYQLTIEEQATLDAFRKDRAFDPAPNTFVDDRAVMDIDTGVPEVYHEATACRSAYGKSLVDLAKRNKQIIASTADLGGSVKTAGVEKERPNQYIEFGIAEQNMVSSCGGMSFEGVIPFCSTFGAFMTSRAKDQARVNDINHANVKMVSTHCGLSVGEDGPTHQAIDDMGSFQGLFHTHVCEPADANHCDRLIRYAASHYGCFYIRMGRHNLPILRTEDGSLLYDAEYTYEYGRTDVLKSGNAVTIVTAGSMVGEVLQAVEGFDDIEIIIASTPKKFDDTLKKSIAKTGKILTVEDHNPYSGYGASVARFALENSLTVSQFKTLGVREYQLSGKPAELYASAGCGHEAIKKVLAEMFRG